VKPERRQKKRIIIWVAKDKVGNETAFATIDLRVKEEPCPSVK